MLVLLLVRLLVLLLVLMLVFYCYVVLVELVRIVSDRLELCSRR